MYEIADIINKIHCADSLVFLKEMPDECVDCVVTSPPYWGLRDYGIEGQLGLEPTIELYISHLIEIFAECKRVLKKTGTMWINIGDSYAGSGKGIGSDHGKAVFDDSNIIKTNWQEQNIPLKSLCQIPERLSIAMTDQLGLIKRNTIIWWKRNCMPSSASDRFTVDFEFVYFFTKSQKYWFKQQLEESLDPQKDIVRLMKAETYSQSRQGGNSAFKQKNRDINYVTDRMMQGRNKRTVWDIPTEPSNDWVKTSRLSAVSDVASGDIWHIGLLGCIEHEDYLAQVSKDICDEPQDAFLNRIKRIDIYLSQEQVCDFFPIVKPLVCYSWECNSGYSRLEYLSSATHRNNENHRKARALLTSLSCNSFCKILSRIENRQDALLLSLLYLGTNGSNISLDGMDAHLLVQIPNRKVDKISCSYCQYYHKIDNNSSHFAVFPRSLVYTPIKAGCPPQGIVLDPFAGTGTTCLEAKEQGKNYIGIELSEEYIEISNRRLSQEVLSFTKLPQDEQIEMEGLD